MFYFLGLCWGLLIAVGLWKMEVVFMGIVSFLPLNLPLILIFTEFYLDLVSSATIMNSNDEYR